MIVRGKTKAYFLVLSYERRRKEAKDNFEADRRTDICTPRAPVGAKIRLPNVHNYYLTQNIIKIDPEELRQQTEGNLQVFRQSNFISISFDAHFVLQLSGD